MGLSSKVYTGDISRYFCCDVMKIFRRLSARHPSLSTAGVNSENSERGDLDTCQLKRYLLFYWGIFQNRKYHSTAPWPVLIRHGTQFLSVAQCSFNERLHSSQPVAEVRRTSFFLSHTLPRISARPCAIISNKRPSRISTLLPYYFPKFLNNRDTRRMRRSVYHWRDWSQGWWDTL